VTSVSGPDRPENEWQVVRKSWKNQCSRRCNDGVKRGGGGPSRRGRGRMVKAKQANLRFDRPVTLIYGEFLCNDTHKNSQPRRGDDAHTE
jgi:hypothetical protein